MKTKRGLGSNDDGRVRMRVLFGTPRWFCICAGSVLAFGTGYCDEAPGAPGAASHWASAAKDFVAGPLDEKSSVYFTGAQGAITEVFYPAADCVQNVGTQLIVMDAARTWDLKSADETKQKKHETSLVNKRAMVWRTVTTADNGKWRIRKEIFIDPTHNSLIQRITFQTLEPGKSVRDYTVYLYNDPAINNSGGGEHSGTNDDSRTASGKRIMAVASEPGSTASALAASIPWKTVAGHVMLSNGFVGQSDGLTDLFGGSCDRAMDWCYDAATGGNVAQMGWLDFGNSTQTSISFDVVLAFGSDEQEAITTANATLDSNLDDLEKTVIAQWNEYTKGLNDQGGTADDQYYLAAMILKSIQDKNNGAMIAGPGTPWGEMSGDGNKGGYHMVWARDLFKFASALATAGDTASAGKAVDFLFNIQMQQSVADGEHYSRVGRFPQNSYVNGTPNWNGTQMDEASMPIVLAWRLNRVDLWPQIKKAADFVVANGPATGQERWEETGGYSPSTIAAEIAGLVCAGNLAEAAGDKEDASIYLRKADEWRNNVANWTFTTTGHYGDGRYYIRIDKEPDPNKPAKLMLGNGAGAHDQRDIVDGGFLELVRFGVMSPKDWTIVETLPKYDMVLKQTIPGKGDAWFRYNYDGYGEDNSGHGYNGTGRGRLWPIFTAERGIYEISASGKGSAGKPYLVTLGNFSSPAGLIPEQVWNISASITGWQTTTPPGCDPGTATGSMRPLDWAMGEYINLLAAIHSGHGDAPAVVVKRYSTDKPQATVTFSVNAGIRPGESVYLVGDDPLLSQWVPASGIKLARKGSEWSATVSLPASRTFHYTYVKYADPESPLWDTSPRRVLRTPPTGTANQTDTFR